MAVDLKRLLRDVAGGHRLSPTEVAALMKSRGRDVTRIAAAADDITSDAGASGSDYFKNGRHGADRS